MKTLLNREEILGKLAAIEYAPDKASQHDQLTQTDMAGALLALAQLDHDREYALCRALAEFLLGHVPEPEDIEDAL